MFRFEHGYPYSSCYTEPNLRYLANKSRSLFFNKEKFTKYSLWMGIDLQNISKKMADRIQSMYGVKNKDYQFLDKRYGFAYACYNRVGTRFSDVNDEPFFYRQNNDVIFSIRAIFAGRDHDKKIKSLRESCDAKCLVCGTRIANKKEFHDRNLRGGISLRMDANRFEIICKKCFLKWIKFNGRPTYGSPENLYINMEEQISFVRFITSQFLTKSKKN